MNEAPAVPGIRPAMDTLRELDEKQFLDKLAVAIHEATGSVREQMKPAKITITIDVAPATKQRMVEPVITIEAEIVSKLPKPEASKALFFIDGDGNPTTNQQRQRDLGLSIAGHDQQEGVA